MASKTKFSDPCFLHSKFEDQTPLAKFDTLLFFFEVTLMHVVAATDRDPFKKRTMKGAIINCVYLYPLISFEKKVFIDFSI